MTSRNQAYRNPRSGKRSKRNRNGRNPRSANFNNNNRVDNSRRAAIHACFGVQTMNNFYLPQWQEAKIRYADNYPLTVLTAGTVLDEIYNLNGPYDPYQPTGGHQPLGFDQLSAIYQRYVCDSVMVKITFPSSNDVYAAAYAAINGSVSFSTAADFTRLLETKTARNVSLGYAGGATQYILDRRVLPKLTGVGYQKYYDTSIYSASVSAVPTENIHGHVVLYNPNAVSVTVSFLVEIEFRTIFFDPIIPSQSASTQKILNSRAKKSLSDSDVTALNVRLVQ